MKGTFHSKIKHSRFKAVVCTVRKVSHNIYYGPRTSTVQIIYIFLLKHSLLQQWTPLFQILSVHAAVVVQLAHVVQASALLTPAGQTRTVGTGCWRQLGAAEWTGTAEREQQSHDDTNNRCSPDLWPQRRWHRRRWGHSVSPRRIWPGRTPSPGAEQELMFCCWSAALSLSS